jgi:hypothetical protein
VAVAFLVVIPEGDLLSPIPNPSNRCKLLPSRAIPLNRSSPYST